MKTKIIILLSYLFLFVLFIGQVHAEDLRRIGSLAGTWRFSIGDDSQWASPAFNDTHWDQLTVPGNWENQGYAEYNGYAWYRKTFKLGDLPDNSAVFLMLGRIDDADAVYLNGELIGRSGSFPPNFVTAYDKVRKYSIPTGLLKENAVNVIAVRVYDTFLEGGFISGTAGFYIDADNDLLNLKLAGNWKFRTGDNKEWRSPDVDDSRWKTIQVPSEWENEGYQQYDGYAWYRLQFRIPQNLNTSELYLVLGKIDDIDEVYLNGKFLGTVYDLRKDNEYRRSGWEYNARRIYRIGEGMLHRGAVNTLAIRVYDSQLRGGIYEGPVGIMTAENYRKYRSKYQSSQPFWDQIHDMFHGQ
jgi:sialate O-acetylesterase